MSGGDASPPVSHAVRSFVTGVEAGLRRCVRHHQLQHSADRPPQNQAAQQASR